MIREATNNDIARIVELGSRSLEEGPYKDQVADNPRQTAKLAFEVMEKGTILVADVDGEVVGILAFIMFPHYFSGELTAGETMWYVIPEHRKMESFGSSIALQLLDEAERIAKESGAKKMQLTAPTDRVGKLYERRGYKQVEVSYQREL